MKSIIQSLLRGLGFEIRRLKPGADSDSFPKFANNPTNVRIALPRQIINPERITLGNNVHLGPGCLIYALTHYPTAGMKNPSITQSVQTFDSKIVIGNNVSATAGLQIAAQSEVVIGDDVMFASNIHINDGMHGFETAEEPYKYQPIFRIDPIRIERGCWIGQNVVILPGVSIGELCIIGANSVVTRSIPGQCIAFGSPAKVVKKWDRSSQSWIAV